MPRRDVDSPAIASAVGPDNSVGHPSEMDEDGDSTVRTYAEKAAIERRLLESLERDQAEAQAADN